MSKNTISPAMDQSIAQWREAFGSQIAAEGFVPTTEKAYARALDRFSRALKGCTPADATIKDAKAYLAPLKRTGRSQCIRDQASAALHFFFERVRHLDWEPVSPLRQRMIEDMQLNGFAMKTQASYVRSIHT